MSEIEEDTTRDALNAAFDEQEPELESEETQAAPEAKTETVEPLETPAAPTGEQAEVPETPELAPVTESGAPQSWTPEAREEWAKLPKAVQDHVTKRENEVQQVMADSAQARHNNQQFEQVTAPYQQLFQQNGIDPIGGVNAVLETAAPLYGGTPQQKVEVVAGIIQQFGIDISMLDDLLVGNQAPAQSPEMQGMQDQMNQMSQFIQGQQNQQQQQTQQQQTEANNEVGQFMQQNEFANDLRPIMADFMNVAGQQGHQLSLQDAYDRAIATRPDIQQIISNRANGISNEAAIGKARQAGVSVPQVGGGVGDAPPPASMGDAIRDAWNNT